MSDLLPKQTCIGAGCMSAKCQSGRYVGRRICIAGTKAIKAMLPAMAKAAP
jgi:hypothetical protein